MASRPEHHYLLKGLVRCAYCGMPMWAQTYYNGRAYYREEQRKLLVTMLDAVYIDTKNDLVVAVKPKPPFIPVFRVAASRDGSEIRIINEPVKDSALYNALWKTYCLTIAWL